MTIKWTALSRAVQSGVRGDREANEVFSRFQSRANQRRTTTAIQRTALRAVADRQSRWTAETFELRARTPVSTRSGARAA